MRHLILLLTLCTYSFLSYAQLSIDHLLTEGLNNPMGIGEVHPRFSWQIHNPTRNTQQTAYEIKVSDQKKKTVWHSGKVSSDSSVHVVYKGNPLRSDTHYQWQVRVWDNHGNVSKWSDMATFHIGLLDPSEWKSQWIQAGFEEDAAHRPAPLLRKSFVLSKKVKHATAYITAQGMYEAYLNGQRIGDAHYTPGWTSYNKKLQYQAYDVTAMLQNQQNTVGAVLGNGWYRSQLLGGKSNNYGDKLALLLQINITYTDGTEAIICSDESWKSESGEIVYTELYHGETIDARKQKEGWLENGYDDSKWYSVNILNAAKDRLVATVNEPIKKQEVIKPVKIFTTPAGEQVIDFGQNLAGWVKMNVKGRPGDTVVLSHAEVLDQHGNFYTENLRSAKAQNKYILKGGGTETFHPHFTWQGFRYVKVEGYPGEIRPENFEAVVLYSSMAPAGTFATSNELINQLQSNIVWGQKGNFLDVPTDCPQRDERLGWTGDAQVFFRTATFNMNVHNFFTKWMNDLEIEQIDGHVPHVIPNIWGHDGNSAGWADAATIIPWGMYQVYGDRRVLERQYHSMKSFVESVRRTTKDNLWNTTWHFGDWLFYRPLDDKDGITAITDKHLIAQCFYAHSTQILIRTAEILGKTADVKEYSTLLEGIKEAFNKEYVTGSGRLVSDTQTAYTLALQFDMLPESERPQAAKRLVANIERYGNHLTTGFLGTPYLCHVLTRYGYTDVAYKLLLQDTYPSWLYPVKKGATTIWERWDGVRSDGSFQNWEMNSFNHYAYGAIGDWMYRKMVGIDTDESATGYKRIQIKPHIGGGFTQASASFKTYYGTVSNAWKIADNKLTMDVEIPVNTVATIYIPAQQAAAITESMNALSSVKDIHVRGIEDAYVVVEVGSGKYKFDVALTQMNK